MSIEWGLLWQSDRSKIDERKRDLKLCTEPPIDSLRELETSVSDFETARKIFEELGSAASMGYIGLTSTAISSWKSSNLLRQDASTQYRKGRQVAAEQYMFLQRDLDALRQKVAQYDDEWRSTLSGIHDSTTQSSETWHDNPQFDDVQQRARMLETERRKLSNILHSSVLVEPSAPGGQVHVGSVVRVRYETGAEERFIIGSYMVLNSEDDERISYAAPLSKLLLGHTKGETVSGKIGARKMQLEILEVSVSREE